MREVTQKGEFDPELLAIRLERESGINADSEYLRVLIFEVGDIRLISLKFSGSASGKSQNEERKNNILLASEVTQTYLISILVGQFEVRCYITNTEVA